MRRARRRRCAGALLGAVVIVHAVELGCSARLLGEIIAEHRARAQSEGGWVFRDCAAEVGSICIDCADDQGCVFGDADAQAVQCMSEAWEACEPAEASLVIEDTAETWAVHMFIEPAAEGCRLIAFQLTQDDERAVEMRCAHASFEPSCPGFATGECVVVAVHEVAPEWE